MKKILVLSAMICSLSLSANAADYSPDIIKLSQEQNYVFPSSPELDLSDGGAIEFWIAPGWEDELSFDPPAVVNIGPEGVSYLISVLRDRSGFAFSAGDSEDVFIVDLNDDYLHHFAMNIVDDGVVVYVDGNIVGTSELRPAALPSAGLFIGGLEDENANRFTGAFGQLRLWDEPLLIEDIRAFSQADVITGNETGHPDIDHLSAMSDFAAGELLLVDSVEPIQ